jgi:hypothetical protein
MVGELFATHARHDHVCKQQVNWPGISRRDFESLHAVARFKYRVSRGLKELAGQIAHAIFVFH